MQISFEITWNRVLCHAIVLIHYMTYRMYAQLIQTHTQLCISITCASKFMRQHLCHILLHWVAMWFHVKSNLITFKELRFYLLLPAFLFLGTTNEKKLFRLKMAIKSEWWFQNIGEFAYYWRRSSKSIVLPLWLSFQSRWNKYVCKNDEQTSKQMTHQNVSINLFALWLCGKWDSWKTVWATKSQWKQPRKKSGYSKRLKLSSCEKEQMKRWTAVETKKSPMGMSKANGESVINIVINKIGLEMEVWNFYLLVREKTLFL